MSDPKKINSAEADEDEQHRLIYNINDVPPWYISMFIGLQVSISNCEI